MNIRAKILGRATADGPPVLQAKSPKGARADELRTVAVSREERRRADGRNEDRHRLCDETVRVLYEGDQHDVELINLSGGGAMVSGDFEPTLWDKLELHLGPNGTIECAVRWLRDERIGLEFAHETRLDCPADAQAELLRQVINRSFPDAASASRVAEDKPTPAKSPPAQPPHEQRAVSRHPLIWSGVLHHDFQSTPVRVRNISATGAMIQSSTPVRVGAEPLLELSEAASISGTVEWAVGDQVGLRFHHEFDMSLLAKSRPEVAPAKWVRPAYLDQGGQTDSPWDPRWNRLSLNELSEELEGFLKR